jgi:hypothetical protein
MRAWPGTRRCAHYTASAAASRTTPGSPTTRRLRCTRWPRPSSRAQARIASVRRRGGAVQRLVRRGRPRLVRSADNGGCATSRPRDRRLRIRCRVERRVGRGLRRSWTPLCLAPASAIVIHCAQRGNGHADDQSRIRCAIAAARDDICVRSCPVTPFPDDSGSRAGRPTVGLTNRQLGVRLLSPEPHRLTV